MIVKRFVLVEGRSVLNLLILVATSAEIVEENRLSLAIWG